jgi:nucleoside-diphosphate-sugar epimerase
MKTVLITGGSGFIGSNLTKRLISQGIQPHLLTREKSSHWRLHDLKNQYLSHHVELTNIEDLQLLLKKINPDTIFHLASHGVIDAHASTEMMCRTNILGTFSLLECCKDLDISAFVYTGTCFEYTQPEQILITEKDEPRPFTLYGATKFAGTMAVQWAARALKLPTIVIRPFTTYGPLEDSTRLVIRTIRHVLHYKPPHIAASNPVRDFVFVEDIIDALLEAAKSAKKYPGEIINISSGTEHHLSEIANTVIDIEKSDVVINFDEASKYSHDHFHWAADNTKAKNLLGWKPKHSLREGLEKTLKWLKENDHLYPVLS